MLIETVETCEDLVRIRERAPAWIAGENRDLVKATFVEHVEGILDRPRHTVG